MSPLRVTRHANTRLLPDPRRVIAKPFLPGDQIHANGMSRLGIVLQRILAMPEDEVVATLKLAWEDFAPRHPDLDAVLARNFEIVAQRLDDPAALSEERRQLIGAYFTHEFSIEAAALGNPSIVAAPDQSGLSDGEQRFVLSLRAVGEGHISSIEFRTGVIGPGGEITIDEPRLHATTGDRTSPTYDKNFFTTKLGDLGALNDVALQVLTPLASGFTMADLEASILALDQSGVDRVLSFETTRLLHWLASSNYTVSYAADTDLSERVIFPGGPTESNGMEDTRLVRFVDDDGEVTYYGTYTAFDGYQILPQLLETADFTSFRISTLGGSCAQNKGIALFPRKVGGQFMALGRHDNVNNFLMTSSDIRVWRETDLIQEPKRPWELMQLGNCGSPLETEAGWLVITHGVGPFRRYAVGCLLLDIDDPHRVIGHLEEPLLEPGPDEREGYVPNVVYSCGSMIHGDYLVLPYGFADHGASFATVVLADLLDQLTA